MTAGLLGMAARASLSAGVMILVVVLLRHQFQSRTPRRVFCLLWDMVLCRLLILSDIPSPVSVQRLLALGQRSGGEAAARPVSSAEAGVYLVEGSAFALHRTSVSAAPVVDWTQILTAVWLMAALAGLCCLVWRHLQSRRIYAASAPVRDTFVLGWQADHPLRRPVQIRSCGWITSPLTYGVVYPVVLLPEEMDLTDREGLACVLAHEYTHIRRFDTLRKGLLAGALCMHWFNPLVWAMYALANRDMELACDEAVVRSGADRREYALALLRLEEPRGGAALSGSYFSKNPLEERIRAIMKMKKVSLAALLAVLVVMSIATTVFATSAPGKAPEASGAEIDFGIQPKQIVEGDALILSNGEDGERLFSVDDGKTWLTEERFHAQYGDWGDSWDVEWWTADEFAAWLEQEKKALQDIIGERAYTGADGWFVWDQERVDETIALYEEMLSDIQKGALYSKTIWDKDGNALEDVALGSDGPLDAVVATVTDDSISAADKEPLRGDSADTYALLAEAESFGLTSAADGLYYNGKRVRMLVDGVSTGNGGYGIRYVYWGDWGEVDVHTLRSVRDNGDGSYDPMGDLIGLAAAGDANFDQGLIDCARPAAGEQVTAVAEGSSRTAGGRSFQEIFSQYESYGLSYTPVENSYGTLAYNDQPVAFFADLKPNGGSFSYQNPYAEEGLRIYTHYDEQGNLTGLTAKAAS